MVVSYSHEGSKATGLGEYNPCWATESAEYGWYLTFACGPAESCARPGAVNDLPLQGLKPLKHVLTP
ncbi:hypothetical protein GUITHDRAFT_122773 [Guillardia theta CCMP2712]|uniref:Uncharacterized protein n=1 Tax=Guillardia theta (strain CCMP2712) TaxID=905079 RepID=L1I552_GUITC|nr:hypothetical protein GUITHDRAFT_122773 [Guillardia theta CCMP2712]EKX31019.1 hypothetical protein GUITHDRAFT_122773 [Guillardia theta CCMP2712]|eukprot:XP_005817999.1 hypothetical protein GUITHDRAFT_122773 [Guillardia theta CCMP2712]